MKIVDRKTFLSLPAGILFSKYAPCFFEALEIKGETLNNCQDFGTQQISDAFKSAGSDDYFEQCDRMSNGESIGMDFECQGRDGCFDDEQLFAVWEKADLDALISRLQQCIGAT